MACLRCWMCLGLGYHEMTEMAEVADKHGETEIDCARKYSASPLAAPGVLACSWNSTTPAQRRSASQLASADVWEVFSAAQRSIRSSA